MAPMPVHELRRLIEGFGCEFALIFGQTEMSPVTTVFRPKHQLTHSGAVGTPSTNVQIAIMARYAEGGSGAAAQPPIGACCAVRMNVIGSIERAWRARRRRRLLAALVGSGLVLACLALSARTSEAYPDTLAAGLPRVSEYFNKLLPTLRWHALFAGVKTEGFNRFASFNRISTRFSTTPTWLTSPLRPLSATATEIVALCTSNPT
jgi:hypothetical protein